MPRRRVTQGLFVLQTAWSSNSFLIFLAHLYDALFTIYDTHVVYGYVHSNVLTLIIPAMNNSHSCTKSVGSP